MNCLILLIQGPHQGRAHPTYIPDCKPIEGFPVQTLLHEPKCRVVLIHGLLRQPHARHIRFRANPNTTGTSAKFCVHRGPDRSDAFTPKIPRRLGTLPMKIRETCP